MHVQLAPRRREAVATSRRRTSADSGGERGPGHVAGVEGVEVVVFTWRHDKMMDHQAEVIGLICRHMRPVPDYLFLLAGRTVLIFSLYTLMRTIFDFP